MAIHVERVSLSFDTNSKVKSKNAKIRKII
jgi:hypothetical protein